MKKNKNTVGMSLLEILVVVAIFSVLGVLVTRSVLLTLRGSKKGESQVKVRENLSYSLAVIERQLRNADSISECPNSDLSVVNYFDERGVLTSFSCVGLGGDDAYVASGSSRLTSDQVKVTSCSFSCSLGTSNNPPVVDVNITATDPTAQGIEGATVNLSTQISLRNY